ncbi:hypothetical protein MYX76_11570 [Desulfobacterota bacterium AH_259_B03_O07]|nr:hypothetical protein [Desulfobacterota bacterium AH_259_B03_O07]
MKTLKTNYLLAVSLIVGLFVFVIGVSEVFAGTATGSGREAKGGEKCGELDGTKSTGTLDVTSVTIIDKFGTETLLTFDVHYKLSGNKSTKPKIIFLKDLNSVRKGSLKQGDNVSADITTSKSGDHGVLLMKLKKRC